jgi:glycosyltransferase involved in cell wall biosynthesis
VRIVHYYPGAGEASGVTVALWAWARAVAGAGQEVTVVHAGTGHGRWSSDDFTLGGSGGTRSAVGQHATQHIGRGRLTRFPVRLGRWLRGADLLVLHEGWVLANLVAAESARRAGVPYVVMPHGVYARPWRHYLKGPALLRNTAERHILSNALAVHIFFASEADDVRDLAPTVRFITVPTGFDVPEARWRGDGDYVSWIGRLDPNHKGLDLLIRAVELLPAAERPRIVLRGYDYKGGLGVVERMIADRCLGDWIQVWGVAVGQEKLDFLVRARAYVHPSRWESYGLALVENLALGVPCLASSSIAMSPDLVRHSAAVLVEPAVRDLARALGELSGLPAGIGERGREFVARELDWGRCTAAFLAALRGLGVT